MSFLARAARAALAFLRREPVAVWGVVVAAALAALPALGVSASTVATIGAVVSLLGVPVVRAKVTPTDALKALVTGKAAKRRPRTR